MLQGIASDYSGNGTAATITGTPVYHAPLVANAEKSTVVGGGTAISFPMSYWTNVNRDRAWSLEAWILPISTVDTANIATHTGQADGLRIVSGRVQFTMAFEDAGADTIVLEHVPPTEMNMHVVINFSLSALTMYVNGQIAATQQLTENQMLSSFAITTDDSTLRAGGAGGIAALQAFAWYGNVLSDAARDMHYSAGFKVTAAAAVGAASQPNNIDSDISSMPIFLYQEIDEEDEWKEGSMVDITTDTDALVAQINTDGVSIPGTWMGSFPLFYCDPPVASGVVLDWESEGANISVSLDGTTWVTPVKGQKISLINDGFITTDKDLWLRVQFTGGKTNDMSYVSSLSVTGYKSNISPEDAANKLSLSNAATLRKAAEPIEYRSDAGIRLDGGSLTVEPNNSVQAVAPRSLEFWGKSFAGKLSSSVIMTNTVANPSFEVNATQYTGANVTVTRVSDWAVAGTWSGRIDLTASGVATSVFPTAGATTVHPASNGDYVSARVALKATRPCRIRLIMTATTVAGGSVVGHPAMVEFLDLVAGQTAVLEAKNFYLDPAYPTAERYFPALYVSQAGGNLAPNWTGDTLRIDAFAAYTHGSAPTTATTLPYFDGTTPGGMWTGTANNSPSMNGTLYINGVATDTYPPAGHWALYTITSTADITGDISIGGKGIVMNPQLYSKTLTAAEAMTNFKSYTGLPTMSVTSSSTLAVLPAGSPVKIYAHNWETTGTAL